MSSPPRTSGCSSSGCDHDASRSQFAVARYLEIVLAIIAVCTLLTAWVIAQFDLAGSQSVFLSNALYWIAFVSSGLFPAIDTLKSLARGRLTIDSLMVAAGLGAAAIGHMPEGALLLTLFSTGHAAEHHAMNRADRSIRALTAMRPATATRLDTHSGQTQEVPVEEVRVGDTVLVRPDSRVPVDGVVIFGQTSIDQSPITGESIPVDKSAVSRFNIQHDKVDLVAKEHQVFAGTLNGSGVIHVVVTRNSNESTLARVGQLIAEAKTERSPTQRLTESFERRYVPTVMAVVIGLLFAFLVIDEPFTRSLYRAMAVLVAASPCALAIATPSAVLSAIACAGRSGVLIKGGGPLEQLGLIKAIAFDKTGTLTTGRPEVIDCFVMPSVSRTELLQVAAQVQRLSEHPLARAIVRAANEEAGLDAAESTAEVTDLIRVSGQGVKALLNGQPVHIGNLALFRTRGDNEVCNTLLSPTLQQAAEAFQNQGYTIVIVKHADRFLGVIALLDTPREAAAMVIQQLRAVGLGPLVMLSGDHANAAKSIADRLQLDEAIGDLLPDQKVDYVAQMTKKQVTAMVGDGANDAPAMAAASVAIAMGAAGSDVALETADVALMGDDLTKLTFALSLGQAAIKIVRQNLWISLGMIAFLVPATIFGLELGPAVVLHEGSTVVVVLNALRLLGFKAA